MGKLSIVSNGVSTFADRNEAARLLAHELRSIVDNKTVSLGILRGGIVIARQIASVNGTELDIVLSRKIGAPMNPELAVGAVSESGELFVQRETASYAGADDEYIRREAQHQMVEIKRRALLFRKIAPKVPLEGKTVVISDDGVATGATMRAAIWAVRRERPKLLIVAVPVGARETLSMLARDVDEIVALEAPRDFDSVGSFYLRFAQVEDKEVLAILKEYKAG
ncbi:MAG: phosphoribosyltransferase [Elusimicrobia bacterium HGW-Elusimicrobia-1]|jgi:hypothetical protein|nr:MAG: phosphoribosyltransferase [Elusimicrobia bacterium HGW-Elusimicrobia-1]